jgi:hypothetical protein
VVSVEHYRAGVLYPHLVLLLAVYPGHRLEQVARPSIGAGQVQILLLVVRPLLRLVTVFKQVVQRLLDAGAVLALVVEQVDAARVRRVCVRGVTPFLDIRFPPGVSCYRGSSCVAVVTEVL